jgi:hypothetical protein
MGSWSLGPSPGARSLVSQGYRVLRSIDLSLCDPGLVNALSMQQHVETFHLRNSAPSEIAGTRRDNLAWRPVHRVDPAILRPLLVAGRCVPRH